MTNQLLGENYYSMPKLNRFDDYDECMDTYRDEAKYCYVKSVIKAPDYPSKVFNFIQKFSSNVKQHYRHDMLTRGICLNKCAKLISSLANDSIDLHYEPFFELNNTKVRFAKSINLYINI